MASNPAEILGAGQALVPNAGEQMLHEQMGRLQLQGAALQLQAQQQQLTQAKTALQRQQSFGHDMQTFITNPTPQGLASLYGSYPEFAKQAGDAWSALDESRRKSDLTQIGSVAALTARGDYEGAAKLMETRIAADKAAGHDSSDDEALLEHLRSPDPAHQKAALGMASIALAGAVGPEHAGEFLKANGLSNEGFTLNQGDTRYDGQGHVVASSAPKPDYLIIPQGGKAVPVGQSGPQAGGTIQGNSPAPATGAPGGVPLLQAMLPITLGSESGNRDFNPDGTPVVSPKGAKGRMQVMPGTNADPGFGVRPAADDSTDERARVGRDYLAAMMQRYGGDPAKAWAAYNAGPGTVDRALASGGNWLAKMPPDTRKYVVGNMSQLRGPQTAMADNGSRSDVGAGATAQPGDPPGTLYGNQSPGYTVLTPAQAQARGLNPSKTWQSGPDGQTTAIGDAPTTAVPGDPNLTGPAYLESLKNPGLANRLRGIASGMLPYPPQGRTANQTILNALSQFEPTLDANAYNQRKAAVQAFTGNGKGAQTVGSANRLAAHLGDLLDASSHLSGPDLKWGPLSSVVASGMQSFERAAAVKYDTALTFVADEAEKIARNSPGTAHGIELTLKNLSRANSIDTRSAAIKELASLVHGAMEPLQSQYESAFQGAAVRPKVPWISPTARAIYSHAGVDFGDVSIGDGGSAAPATGAVHTGLPAGSHQVGTYQGKPVYLLPSGKRVVAQ